MWLKHGRIKMTLKQWLKGEHKVDWKIPGSQMLSSVVDESGNFYIEGDGWYFIDVLKDGTAITYFGK